MKFFLSLTSSDLLKVTGFLIKILQIKFLVVAEKKIFVFKVFYEKNCCPPLKKASQQLPRKIEILPTIQ